MSDPSPSLLPSYGERLASQSSPVSDLDARLLYYATAFHNSRASLSRLLQEHGSYILDDLHFRLVGGEVVIEKIEDQELDDPFFFSSESLQEFLDSLDDPYLN